MLPPGNLPTSIKLTVVLFAVYKLLSLVSLLPFTYTSTKEYLPFVVTVFSANIVVLLFTVPEFSA